MCRNPTPKYKPIKLLMDTGANFTAFHEKDTNIIDIPTTSHIQAFGPSGAAMHSVGEAKYKAHIPMGMPSNIFNGHKIPALQQHSILSIVKIVDAGGVCTFDKTTCKCSHPHHGTICQGELNTDGLWYMMQNASNEPMPPRSQLNAITSVYQHTRIKDAIQFLHAALYSAPKSTILKASKAGFLSTWPLLKPEKISKYLTETIATKKGHLARLRQNLRSTKRKIVHCYVCK